VGHVAAAAAGVFVTPSRNIVCEWRLDYPVGHGRHETYIACGIHSGLRPPPPKRRCDDPVYTPYFITLAETGRADASPCWGDPGPFLSERRGRVLRYGSSWTGPGMRCTSEFRGLTCRNRQGHGFFLSRQRWHRL
jgi:hypothetical protein